MKTKTTGKFTCPGKLNLTCPGNFPC